MSIMTSAVVVLVLLVAHGIADQNRDEDNQRVIGKREARIALNELRKRHVSHVLKRATEFETTEEEKEIDLDFIERALERYEERLRSTETIEADNHVATGGEKLIQEALTGNVDPNSDVVNLLESMFVNEGSRHNQHPIGIDQIAAKKGKVYGDTHDGHRFTQTQSEGMEQTGDGRKRNFLQTAPLWSDLIIPYTIDSSLANTPSYVDVIDKAIKQFSDYTCLKWVPYGSDEANKTSYSSYIEFFSESGCWSYVGRVFSDKQQISLQAPGCVTLSTTVHEMTHAIGQMHEQSRNDRDNYVTMLWSNINGGTGNYNMAKSQTFDRNPYDYESVLQYSLTSFSTNGQPTIEFKDQRLDFLADSATGLMFYDIKDITDGYDCTTSCLGADGTTPLKQCQNGGFVLHTCNCHCPEGLTGDLCESVATDPECGTGIIDLADGESRTITSPNFSNGGPYPTGKECVWLVKVNNGRLVEMTIEEMDLTTANSACDHWLEIRYNLIGQTGPRRCGQVSSETYYTTMSGNPSMMLLKFDSAFASSATAGKGFNLTVKSAYQGCAAEPCMYGSCTPVDNDNYICSCMSGFSGTHCETYTNNDAVGCDFEGLNCLFDNSVTSTYVWRTHTGSTPSSSTGPSSAKSGNTYLYAEASSPAVQGDSFIFETPSVLAGPKCLTFWYHMYGGSIGSLHVKVNGTELWSRSGDQGDVWLSAEVNVSTTAQNYKLTFEAIRGSSWNGDVAIDDIILTSAACNIQVSTTSTSTTQSSTAASTTTQSSTTQSTTTVATTTHDQYHNQELHCTFETGTSCFLNDIQGDDFDWSTRQGSTPSSSTGPTSAYEGQTYSYIETSSPRTNGDVAILQGPSITTSRTFCLSFAYHMYGSNIDSLFVNLASPNGNQTLFSRNGDAGDSWFVTSISIPATNGEIQFIGVRGSSFRGDIAIDDVHFLDGECSTTSQVSTTSTTQSSTVASTTTQSSTSQSTTTVATTTQDQYHNQELHCTFETGTSCFLNDIQGDDFDWSTRQGSTPSSSTGPTSAYEGQTYSYIETSSPRTNGDVAILQGPSITTSRTFCLSFAYHMYGSNIDSLFVNLASPNGNQTLFSRNGDAGDSWFVTSISIPASNGEIQFIGVRGSSYRGDIAIDDVHFLDGECSTTSTTTAATTPYYNQELHCTFENDTLCFLNDIQGDDFDWSTRQGSTPSSDTGPSSAYEGETYSYIETSSPRTEGDVAILQGPSITTSRTFCLSFAYHMYGSSIGSLYVNLTSTNGSQTLFSQNDNTGDSWFVTSISIPASNGEIQFIGVRGNSYRGDIAIDDVQFLDGVCSTAIPITTPSPNTLPLNCTFEDTTACFLKDVVGSDDFDWTIRSSSTPTSGTGPTSAAEGTKYAYIETSGKQLGSKAILEGSVSVPAADSPICLTFDYHMYGASTGTLEVSFDDMIYFYESGDKGNQWNKAKLILHKCPGNSDVSKITFIGTRGSSYKGDIAIDNVQLTDGLCVT
ncbi:MAM and LDL-receptor class A domain-containing protein 1-like isoform X2 [Crassostrea angulata]|uniref:MAM and LDL-receptor class A domain-containing protein 1-like isoform X2 n=1 Tax=Magallana angulata TaxID=2784310 RepID=UPI0022B1544E|nr:MAM and LDL-receptor class A domain-containing protein 1-like isoform X2 [Crassostrea angulata]